ncbi:transposase [Actinoplanes aureus]|uniref:transposase n=1 Tax=Actinoplanes aureus TaxID=2792083 RepID=UPI0028167D79|nr:transposase [Actinoplanes aureus]
MALVRVYCGLASADDSVRTASAAPLTIAVVDDAGRLLGVHEISDDPAGYAELGSLLVERTTGFSDAAVAADSDDHVVTSLLTAAGRPLVVVDDDDADDFAERFTDDDSPEEIQAPAAARRAVGLARALQAGAIAAVTLSTPRDLVSYKPVLAAHVAMLNGRNSAAVALREVLRELYPAALRAYPDPAHPLALAVLDAVPEPGRLTGRGADPEQTAREIAAELTRAGAGREEQVFAAITALHVAISESPRRGGVNKSLAPAAADAVRQAIGAVRSCDSACSALVGTLSARAMPQTSNPNVGRRAARRASEPAPLQPAPSTESRFGRRGRPEPATTGNGPASPRPMTAPPVAPAPIGPPPVAPAAANGLPGRAGNPGNRPVSVPPPPPGMTPITPGSRPVPSTRTPGAPSSVQPAAGRSSPADAGEPFRPTLTNAEINRARAERQRTVIPARPNTRQPAAANGVPGGPTDYSLPMPGQRPAQETPEPGSRANWPLLNAGSEDVPPAPAAASVSSPPSGRVKPPWQDMPKEPPSLRMSDSQLGGRDSGSGLDSTGRPPLRLIDGDSRTSSSPKLTALDRSTTPPVPADGSDGDLLIFAAARSAWFTGHDETNKPDKLDWTNPNDSRWRAAEKAATPAVAAETSAGLPKRVPQANLVPGSPLREERPLRIVRDAASIAAHTTGYFRGWRRGQEIGGFAMGGRPGREAAGGWDFTRDGQPADDFRNSVNTPPAGYGGR